jgi:hypothetical protein
MRTLWYTAAATHLLQTFLIPTVVVRDDVRQQIEEIVFALAHLWILDRAKVPIGTVLYHLVRRHYPAVNRLKNGV